MATNWPTSRDTFTNPTSGDTLDSPSHAAQHANINDAVEAMQAHAGLVLVKPTSVTGGTIGTNGAVTIGSGVSSVTVNGAFSSTFDNYKIVISNVTGSTTGDILMQLTTGGTASTASYYWATAYVTYSTNAVTGTGGGSPRGDWILSSINSTNNKQSAEVTLFQPFLTVRTNFASTSYIARTDIAGLGAGGMHDVATSYDGIKLIPSAGTFTGGTIRVYGYNNG